MKGHSHEDEDSEEEDFDLAVAGADGDAGPVACEMKDPNAFGDYRQFHEGVRNFGSMHVTEGIDILAAAEKDNTTEEVSDVR